MASTDQALQQLMDPQQWVEIFLCAGVEMAEIYATV